MPLLETILRVNGAALVKVGDLYRVMPVGNVAQAPLPPAVNGKDFPDDERMALNLVFLKYATAGEILKLIQPFLGEGAAAAASPHSKNTVPIAPRPRARWRRRSASGARSTT